MPPALPQLQYWFSTSIENSAAVQSVIQQGLDTTFPISVQEFLASSIEAHKLRTPDQTTISQCS
ncbi:hypothetical protein P691DRAFT_769925 [Macrolepiota fuliginosa MF-IS2]|uniref:Uncharacterized protein n=1 Tax=Macrolepiota fuliginosa MF-IS2 TaxID=1400762 RepID=A0A9P5WWE0_9AGAR|nr:hypothetical protein P691DRAFT_769925 [Macrolepiota fuliginosa MF-IS2]